MCGRKQVAIQVNGRLYWHKWSGLGMWAEGGDCNGIDDGRWTPAIATKVISKEAYRKQMIGESTKEFLGSALRKEQTDE